MSEDWGEEGAGLEVVMFNPTLVGKNKSSNRNSRGATWPRSTSMLRAKHNLAFLNHVQDSSLRKYLLTYVNVRVYVYMYQAFFSHAF